MAGSRRKLDWVGNTRSFAFAWAMPIAALASAAFAPTPARTVVWIGALVWMGAACLANASRCGRVHCYFTGPFLLLMAVVVGLHGFEMVYLGPDGWTWLAISIAAGGFLLWWVPEHAWGKFATWRSG